MLAPAAGGEPVSLFTRALASTLIEGGHASLSAVLADVEKRCDQLARSANLATQRPRMSLPREFSAQLQESLNRAILDRAPEGAADNLGCIRTQSVSLLSGPVRAGA